MRLRHIEVFNAVYTVGTVSGAANYLHITQPTASKILMHAEEDIGFKLFKRIRGRLVPTEEAEILYQQSKLIADQVANLQKVTRNLSEASRGQIKLAAISAVGLEHIPRAIVQYQKEYPDVHFEFQTHHYDNLVASIAQQEKDIGIAFNAQHVNGLNSMNLGTAEFVCIYAGDEFDNYPERIKISDIADKQYISIENSGPLGDLLNKMILEKNLSFQSRITAQTYFVALNLVAMGGGIAIVDEFTAKTHGVGKVKYKAFDPAIRFSIQAVHRDIHPPSKLAQHFLHYLKNEFANND